MTPRQSKLTVCSELKPSANGSTAFVVLYVNCEDRKKFRLYTGISVPYEAPKKKGKKNTLHLQVADKVKGGDLLKLEKLRQDLVDIISSIKEQNLLVTQDRIKEKITEKYRQAGIAEKKRQEKEQTNLLLPYLENLPKRFLTKEHAPIKSQGTKGIYNSLALNIRAFEAHTSCALSLEGMTKRFFQDFNTFLEDRHTYDLEFRKRFFKYYDSELRPNYRHSILKSLKSLLNWLRSEGIKIGNDNELDYTTYKYQRGMRETTRKQYYMSEEFLEKIFALRSDEKILNKPDAEKWILEIDRTILNCWLGQRFGDATRGWDENNIRRHISGGMVLEIAASEKTGIAVKIPIIKGALKILQLRNWKPLPEIDNPSANIWIKKICEAAGLTHLEQVEKKDKNSKERFCDIVSTRYWRRSMVTNHKGIGTKESAINQIAGWAKGTKMLSTYVTEETDKDLEEIFNTSSDESEANEPIIKEA